MPELIEIEVKQRKLGCVGHTLCRDVDNISKRDLYLNSQSSRHRGAPRNTLRPSMESEIKSQTLH